MTTEIFPEIYDDSLPDKQDNEANIRYKRLYLAVRHLQSELFAIDRGNEKGDDLLFKPEPQNFNDSFDSEEKRFSEEKIRFLSIIGQMRLKGYDDPSFARLERWNKFLKDQDNADVQLDERVEFERLFPKGSMRTKSASQSESDKNILWVPGSKRPKQIEYFGDEPHPAKKGEKHFFRVLIVPEFISQFTQAMQRYSAYSELYRQAYRGLYVHSQGKFNGASNIITMRDSQLADVTERLISGNVDPNDPNIQLIVQNVISRSIQSGGSSEGLDGNFSSFGINLPDLDAGTHVEIIKDNLDAVRVIYYSAQLEEMRLYATVDTVVEHAISGMLPISRGPGLDRIYRWMKTAPRRINEFERRGLYARVLGLAQGNVNEPLPNREFSDLWFRFLASVSQKFREITSTERSLVSDEQIHKAGRDLAVNISLHGYGITAPAAIELQVVIQEMMDMLNDAEILRSYGVRDIWQLVDRVSALYLGGAANGVKYRTMAVSGERIIDWLSRKAPILASSSALGLGVTIFDANGTRRPSNEFRTLAELAERWLAVTGTPDEIAERSTDPVDLESQVTVPLLGQNVNMPVNLQDTLNQAGINMPNLPTVPQV